MSKKKRSKSKKRHLQTSSTSTVATSSKAVDSAAQPLAASAVKSTPAAPVAQLDSRAAYVGQDMRRIGIIAVFCIAIEIGLWYLLSHTFLGDSVYRLIKL
jgi:hypothetical protein